MLKRFFVLLTLTLVGACACPLTPQDGDLLRATKQFQPELFNYGARGVVILSMSDNVSDDGWFGKNYTDTVKIKNKNTNDVFFLSTKKGKNDFDTAMLPVGRYTVDSLYLVYVYQTTEQYGNTTYVTTHVETDEGYENGKKISFDVRAGEVAYLGHFDLIKRKISLTDNDDATVNDFELTDKSSAISAEQKSLWKKQFGKDFVARKASVK